MKNLLIAAIALFTAGSAFAQGSYPSRPITMVVGFAPGGGTDTVARILAKSLSDSLGQQVVVENKAGAGGNIATDYVAHAAPDGYTILLGNVGSLAVAPHIIANLPLRPAARLRADHHGGGIRQRAGGAGVDAGADAGRVREARPGETGHGHLRLLRHRRRRPPGGRAAEDARRRSISSTCPTRAAARRCRACWAARSMRSSRRRSPSAGR